MKCQRGSHRKKEWNVGNSTFVMEGIFSNLLILFKQKSIFGKNIVIFAVTPCVGVWIEIYDDAEVICECLSHSLRGSVD